MSTAEERRDIERVEEYRQIYSMVSLKGLYEVELSTGVIRAARFADKMRRVVIAAFGRIAPIEVILRDVSEFNKRLYEEIVEKRKYAKGDLIKITVDAKYDKEANRIVFGEPSIVRYVPETELEELREENRKLKDVIRKLKEVIASAPA